MKAKNEIPKKRIATVELSDKEELVFSLAEPSHGLFIDVRKYVYLEEERKKVPTKQGWFIPAEKATEVREAATAVEEAVARAS